MVWSGLWSLCIDVWCVIVVWSGFWSLCVDVWWVIVVMCDP